MSWDISVQRFPRTYSGIDEIPDEAPCLPVGAPGEVRALISRFFPQTNWADPAWGVFDSDEGSIDFNLGPDDPSTGFMMHVYATAAIVPAVVDMCRAAGWQAFDCSSGDFLECANDPGGWAAGASVASL